MSRLARRALPYLSAALTHARTRAVRRALAEGRRRLAREPHRVRYFHQVDDPYSHLAAQRLGELLARYDVVLEPHLVGPPPDDAAPERERLEAYARRDAADVAPFYGLDFPAKAAAPDPSDVEFANRLAARAIASGRFVEEAASIGGALWQGGGAVQSLGARLVPAEAAAVRTALEAGNALRRRTGHYLGGMFHYGGEWYWGVDRLWHLERRLQGLGRLRPGSSAAPLAARPDPRRDPPVESPRRLRLEFYPSLRSPYTAIAMGRVLELPERLPVDLVLRPVLPMVMRGLPVPAAKRLYIVLDTKREAEDAGEPFGFACDPVGRPVERGYSLFPWAREKGRGAELLHAFTRAAFSEGVDTGTDDGMRHVVERAGLSWDEARVHLDGDDWRDELEANRERLLEEGLWGVPSFRLLGEDGEPDYATWGQDRIWRLELEIRRRLGAA
ncbi:MAG: DsbA family protein [Myxococcota bacterium]